MATVKGGWAMKNENTAQNIERPYVGGLGFMQWNIYRVIITENGCRHDSWKRHRKDMCAHFCFLLWVNGSNAEIVKERGKLVFVGGFLWIVTWSLKVGWWDLKSPSLMYLAVLLRAIHLIAQWLSFLIRKMGIIILTKPSCWKDERNLLKKGY